MPSQATVGAMAEPIVSAVPRPAKHRKSEAPEFPGCRPVHLSRDEVAGYDGRFEYWDRDTEVAMVCEPTSYYHERPAQRLARLVQTIAHVRGTPIEAVGATDLLVRNARGERQRIMQADQILFLRAVETVPRGHAIEVGVDALPDVGQPRVSRLDGGGDTPGAERTGAVGGIRRDPGSGGERAGSSGRDRAGRRSVLAPPAREEPCCRSR